MKHTPIGYDIVDGKAVINKEEAEQVKTLFAGYLLGLSLQAAASMAGLKGVNTSQAKRMLHNRKYLGDDYYPQLMDEETLNAAEEERQRREKILGRDKLPKKERIVYHARTRFALDKIPQKYKNPVKQAEYAYTQIKEVE